MENKSFEIKLEGWKDYFEKDKIKPNRKERRNLLKINKKQKKGK